MSEDQEKRLLCLMVTPEQEELLERIFNTNEWDLIRATPAGHRHMSMPCESLQAEMMAPSSTATGPDLDHLDHLDHPRDSPGIPAQTDRF